jgi:hypothetical protein
MTPAEIAAGARQARRSRQWCLIFLPNAVGDTIAELRRPSNPAAFSSRLTTGL